MKQLAAVALLAFGSSALAAPLLGSTASFNESNFCKTHGCKYVTTVPTDLFDQFIYDLKGGQRVIVWRVTKDQKRWPALNQRSHRANAGKITGVEAVWYGVQDMPVGATELISTLFTTAGGTNVSKALAEKWLDGNDSFYEWGKFRVMTETSSLPGANAGALHVIMSLDPYNW